MGDRVEPGLAPLVLLTGLRLAPAVIVTPILGGPLAPRDARVVLGVMVAVVVGAMQPAALAAQVQALSPGALAAVAVAELAIGGCLAALVALPFAAADTAGRWIGGALAPVGSATDGRRAGATLLGLLSLTVFLAGGGPRVVIAAVVGTYDALPLLGGAPLPGGALAAATGLLASAAALAVPALVVAALVELAVALSGRRTTLAELPVAALRGAAVLAFVAASLALLAVAVRDGQAEALRVLARAVGG